MRNIDLSVDEARRKKWQQGVELYRGGSEETAFRGDPVLELFDELIDGINYAEVAGLYQLMDDLHVMAQKVQRIWRGRQKTLPS